MPTATNYQTTDEIAGTYRQYPEGQTIGGSTTDKLSFYGSAALAQQASTVDLVTQLVNLGLVPSGTILQTQGAAVAAGSAVTLTAASSGKTIALNTATGSTVTLPAATGSGISFKFLVTVLATSNSHKIQVASATDFMIGNINTVSDDAGAPVKGYFAANSGTVATNSDTITLNRSTTGSVTVGEWIEIQDVATATWAVRGVTSSTGTEATPFSAAV